MKVGIEMPRNVRPIGFHKFESSNIYKAQFSWFPLVTSNIKLASSNIYKAQFSEFPQTCELKYL